MASNKKNTAVLLFIRDEHQEVKEKTFFGSSGRKTNLQIVRSLNRHVTSLARKTGLPTIVVKGAQQVGKDFGERFVHALEYGFALGFQQLIAIGNDCPDLSVDAIQQASKDLEKNKLVLGPTKDGGVYILGVHRSHFYSTQFRRLAWQTPQLFQDLLGYAEQFQLTTSLFSEYTDIDNEGNLLAAIRRSFLVNKLLQRLISILASTFNPKIIQRLSIPTLYNHKSSPLRAPPHL